MKRTTLYPLIASLLIGLLGQSSTAQSPKNHNKMVIKNSEQLAELYNLTVVKVAQATSVIDEKKAFNLIWKLPIVQRKAREIEQLSKGTIRVAAVIESSPTPDESYYTIRVVENHVKHVDTIFWFRVLTPSGNIEVLDLVENQYITLDKWKPN
ncbi:hypothetical protein [Calothrix sp. PCC 7507]|uniref:hypothetical protein n=1 Tax=Calothrix sp. PCC 7507 TaxID=99598 RepID=UPI00029F3C18|nr:hypothetical protein [Calothrix sp. PCC 7507]AFY31101.1 hypothetical protein Cal7507_0612 [Calothrix sp. PCC 7507]